MGTVLDKWLTYYDPLHRGWTPRGIANGVCATAGSFFPRVGGGYNLYRGEANAAIDFDLPVGAAGPGARQVATFPWRPARASTAYRYALRAVGGGGVESAAVVAKVTIEYDADGVLVPVGPGSVTVLTVMPQAGGRFEVRWRYVRDGGAVPAAFDVFTNAGGGAVDWVNPVGTVLYDVGCGFYRWMSSAYGHDLGVGFGVRAVSTDGSNDGSVVVVTGRAAASVPAPPANVTLAVEEV